MFYSLAQNNDFGTHSRFWELIFLNFSELFIIMFCVLLFLYVIVAITSLNLLVTRPITIRLP